MKDYYGTYKYHLLVIHLMGGTFGGGIKLTDEVTAYLEEAYVPQKLVGVTEDNNGKSKNDLWNIDTGMSFIQ